MFDADTFLSSTVTEANSTEFIPCPVGEYTAVAGDVKCRQWQSKSDPSKSGLALDILWEIDDANVKEALGRDKVTVKQGLMLDLTESGGLDFGKGRNINLSRLREALGLNKPGEPFAMSMISGHVAKVKVKHSIYNNAPMAEVEAVAKA